MLQPYFEQYCSHPMQIQSIITTSVIELTGRRGLIVVEPSWDRSQIYPAIRGDAWHTAILRTLEGKSQGRSAGDRHQEGPIISSLAPGLKVAYAQMATNHIRYLSQKDLQEIGIAQEALHNEACGNLKRHMVSFETKGGDGYYLLSSPFGFGASLLLFEKIWQNAGPVILGDYVVAVPSDEILLVTGSKDQKGIQKLRQDIDDFVSTGEQLLSCELYIFLQGHIQPLRMQDE